MKVTFSVVDEFLDELRHEQKDVEDMIVRATYRYEQSKDVPFLWYMSVVAGFVVRGKVIELKQAVGDVIRDQHDHDGSRKTKARAEQIMGQIENVVTMLNSGGMGIALHRGVFEV
jgi:hypothetical protein